MSRIQHRKRQKTAAKRRQKLNNREHRRRTKERKANPSLADHAAVIDKLAKPLAKPMTKSVVINGKKVTYSPELAALVPGVGGVLATADQEEIQEIMSREPPTTAFTAENEEGSADFAKSKPQFAKDGSVYMVSFAGEHSGYVRKSRSAKKLWDVSTDGSSWTGGFRTRTAAAESLR